MFGHRKSLVEVGAGFSQSHLGSPKGLSGGRAYRRGSQAFPSKSKFFVRRPSLEGGPGMLATCAHWTSSSWHRQSIRRSWRELRLPRHSQTSRWGSRGELLPVCFLGYPACLCAQSSWCLGFAEGKDNSRLERSTEAIAFPLCPLCTACQYQGPLP